MRRSENRNPKPPNRPDSSLRLGRPVKDPAEFIPTKSLIIGQFIYQLDSDRGLCHRRPLHWDARASSGYFRLIAGRTESPARRPRQVWPRTVRVGLQALLVMAIILVAYPLIPGWRYQVKKQLSSFTATSATAATDIEPIGDINQLVIPKIGVRTAILEAPTLDILKHQEGVWHQTGDVITGNLVLAGHRFKYLPPNTSTFYNLGQLAAGDKVLVDWSGRRYTYTVDATKTVPATQTDVLAGNGKPRLTLYTCSDKSQSARIVVTAAAQP